MQSIPLIDISGAGGATAAIEDACHEVGFMYVTGHGIAPAVIENLRTTVIDYFSLPLQTKLGDKISRDNYRGYIPAGFFNPNSGDGSADNYEGYKLHYEVRADDPLCAACDLYGPNKWPAFPEHFKLHVLDYWRECDRVAAVLLGALADILGVGEGEFLRQFQGPLTNMTLLHYPPQDPDIDGFGIHPHKDTDALTILAPDPVGGLMVRCRDDRQWIRADPPGGALIVNIGDLLELWSGGYFVSTPHKVTNSSGAERYSFPYFAVPHFETEVAPLIAPQPEFRRRSVNVGEASREVWRTNWPDVGPIDANIDPATLEH